MSRRGDAAPPIDHAAAAAWDNDGLLAFHGVVFYQALHDVFRVGTGYTHLGVGSLSTNNRCLARFGRWLRRRVAASASQDGAPMTRSALSSLGLLVGLVSSAIGRPAEACGSWALVDEDSKAELRFAAHTVTLGGDRHAVVLRRGAATRYSGRGRPVCGRRALTERLADIRARAILGALWFELREQLAREATVFATSELLRKRSMAFAHCWGRSLQSDGPSGPIEIEVKLRLGPDRRVSEVELEGSTRAVLSRCLRAELRGWRFPPAVGREARFPLILHVASD